MKRRFSFTKILHNDKLMIVLSLFVAIGVWMAVSYGTANVVEREITGVPVSIVLNDYASETMKLRIISGAEATATVRVEGSRAVVDQLTAKDITVTADTGNVIKEGTYVLELRATTNGDYSIVSVVGNDGTSQTVTITCDVWREQELPVTVSMPDLTVMDVEKNQLGTPSFDGEAISDGKVTVVGPKSDINRIDRVVAEIKDKKAISEATVFDAELVAYDEDDRVIQSITFKGIEDDKVSVTVPIMVYRKINLKPTLVHVPAGYKYNANLYTISPSSIELWGVPAELDDYVADLNKQLTIDFDKLYARNLSRKIQLESNDSVRLVNSKETINLRFNIYGVSTRTVEVPLSNKRLQVKNCPDGYTVELAQNKLYNVKLCGPSWVINYVNPSNIRLVVDMEDKAVVGKKVIKARLLLNQNTAWVLYGDQGGVDVQISVTKK